MATARKLPSGQWRTLIYSHTENGKRIYKSFTAKTKNESERLATQYKALYIINADATVIDAINQYIQVKSNILSPSTQRLYQKMAEQYYGKIEKIKISKLRAPTVQAWINQLSETLSPKTVRNIYGLFTAAVRMQNKSINLDITLPAPRKPHLHTPTDAEVSRLIQLAAQDKNLYIAILLAAFGSLRRSEICALTYKDIHGDYIDINKAMVIDTHGNYVIKPPKTFSSYRQVKLPQFVLDALDGKTGQIITITPHQLTNRFSKLINHNFNIHFRFHDLRHYQASILHALGIPDKYIMERGGWKTSTTLKNIYQHTLADQSQYYTDIALEHFEKVQHKMQHAE